MNLSKTTSEVKPNIMTYTRVDPTQLVMPFLSLCHRQPTARGSPWRVRKFSEVVVGPIRRQQEVPKMGKECSVFFNNRSFSLRAQCSLPVIILTIFMVKGGLTIGQMDHVPWEGLPTTGGSGQNRFFYDNVNSWRVLLSPRDVLSMITWIRLCAVWWLL